METKQDVRMIGRAEGSVDSGFTPEAEAMLAAVEAYLVEHRDLGEPKRKPPVGERTASPDFLEQSPWVCDRRA